MTWGKCLSKPDSVHMHIRGQGHSLASLMPLFSLESYYGWNNIQKQTKYILKKKVIRTKLPGTVKTFSNTVFTSMKILCLKLNVNRNIWSGPLQSWRIAFQLFICTQIYQMSMICHNYSGLLCHCEGQNE